MYISNRQGHAGGKWLGKDEQHNNVQTNKQTNKREDEQHNNVQTNKQTNARMNNTTNERILYESARS